MNGKIGKICIIILTVPENEDVLKDCLCALINQSKAYDYQLIIRKNEMTGYTPNVNKAIKNIMEDPEITHIFFLNDDIIIKEDKWLQYFINMAPQNRVISPPELHRGTHCAMGFTLFDKEVFREIGYFDERYEILEVDDVDMSVRLMDAKIQIGIHEHSGTFRHLGSLTKRLMTDEHIKKMKGNTQRFKDKWKGTKWENAI